MNDTVRVTLTRAAAGGVEIVDGCWMPSVPTTSKVLCAHDIKREHTFTFVLKNDCAIPVKLRLTVKRARIAFRDPECDIDKGRVVFDDFLGANGGTVTQTCSTKPHWKWPLKWKKKASYAIVATHVRQNGMEAKLGQPVTFDPEIIIEDNGKHSFMVLVALGVFALGLAYAIYRLLRRA